MSRHAGLMDGQSNTFACGEPLLGDSVRFLGWRTGVEFMLRQWSSVLGLSHMQLCINEGIDFYLGMFDDIQVCGI